MKIVKLLFALLYLIIICFIISCDRGIISSSATPSRIDLTPRENAEAEEAALWLSGDLIAPQELYDRVLDGFRLLREKYGDSIPQVNIPFKLPISTNAFKLKLSDSAAMEFRSENYKAWDSLNMFYKYMVLDTNTYSWGFQVWLISEGRYNNWEICDMYAKLPGVDWAFPGYYCCDWPITYPWIDEYGRLSFLVRDAWGDCPSGCMYSNYYYFKMQSGDIEYIGDWQWNESPPPIPVWWDEASIGVRAYYYYPNEQP